ncbi:hypothetical protein FRB96_004111 [Tulasnella sp. 330]|nr:hypothetical protein FRB96_004111 [Tulasnella sp. 330]
MITLPVEILIAITTSDTQFDAYTYSSEVKATLRNIALVNNAFYEWSNELLYRRVTVTDDQIRKLRATLASTTPRAISLAKRIHSLRLRVADVDSDTYKATRFTTTGEDEDVTEASALLRILARNATLKRLFVDMDLTVGVIDLQNSIGSFTTLSELVLGNQENVARDFFWMIELAQRQWSCLRTLRALTVLDVNICHYPDMDIVLPQLTNIEELVIIRPWGSTNLEQTGKIFAELFAPPRSLKGLTIILAGGWAGWPIRRLKAEDLGPAMTPYADQLLILPEDGSLTSLMSWGTIRDMIGTGHKWEMGSE